MTFFDLPSLDSSDRASTPKQRRRVRLPNPDDENLHSLDSYTKTKHIPKKDKKVEELKLQYECEIKNLFGEMELIRAEQRWFQPKSVAFGLRVRISQARGTSWRKRQQYTTYILYNMLHYSGNIRSPSQTTSTRSLTLSDLRTQKTADITGRKVPRCHSSAVVDNPPGMYNVVMLQRFQRQCHHCPILPFTLTPCITPRYG